MTNPIEDAKKEFEEGQPASTAMVQVSQDNGPFAILLDHAKFNQLQRVAKMFAASKMVPDRFKNDVASIATVVQMAFRMEIDPLMMIQKSYLVHGTPGIEGQLAIALINSRGPFKENINFRFKGEAKTRECTAFGIMPDGSERTATVTWAMVEAEGWSKKGGSKWLSLPDQMFRYRSAVFLGRAHCPEVLMGMSTLEELEDVHANTAESRTVIIPADGAPPEPAPEPEIIPDAEIIEKPEPKPAPEPPKQPQDVPITPPTEAPGELPLDTPAPLTFEALKDRRQSTFMPSILFDAMVKECGINLADGRTYKPNSKNLKELEKRIIQWIEDEMQGVADAHDPDAGDANEDYVDPNEDINR